jgi:FkbM family methyltransferase
MPFTVSQAGTGHRLVAACQRALAQSRWATHALVRVRNQANVIIARHLSDGPDPRSNGEFLVAGSVAPHCQYFVDVGANVGNYATVFMAGATRLRGALLFEPGRKARALLERRIGDFPSAEVSPSACGRERGLAEFFEEPDAGETSSLVQGFSRPDAQRISVPVTTLDEEVAERLWPRVDFLKIDAEGHDQFVLEGAEKLLARQRIQVLQFEYNYPWMHAGATLGRVMAMLSNNSYKVYLIRHDGLQTFDYERYGDFFGYANFLAIAEGSYAMLDRSLFVDAGSDEHGH